MVFENGQMCYINMNIAVLKNRKNLIKRTHPAIVHTYTSLDLDDCRFLDILEAVFKYYKFLAPLKNGEKMEVQQSQTKKTENYVYVLGIHTHTVYISFTKKRKRKDKSKNLKERILVETNLFWFLTFF